MTSTVTERVPAGAVMDAARGGMSACRGRVTTCWVDALATRLGVVIGLAGGRDTTTSLPQRRGWLGSGRLPLRGEAREGGGGRKRSEGKRGGGLVVSRGLT